jgi:hypothetical protein
VITSAPTSTASITNPGARGAVIEADHCERSLWTETLSKRRSSTQPATEPFLHADPGPDFGSSTLLV